MKKVTVFGNFCIDSEERFLRLKDSFFSFYKANIDSWRINVRGRYKHKVKNFLEENINKDIKIFFLETEAGWATDSKEIIKDINSILIFIWIEDHICIKSSNEFNNAINEMCSANVENLVYSWFHNGRYKVILRYIPHEKLKHICTFDLNEKSLNIINKNDLKSFYPITLVNIMSLNFFKKNLELTIEKKKIKKNFPFNFERSFSEIENLNFKNGVLNNELFVSIDDDHSCQNSSLISRGLYPNRQTRDKMLKLRKLKYKIFRDKNLLNKIKDRVLSLFK